LEAWSESAAARRHEWSLYAHAPAALPGRWNEQLTVIDGGGGTRWEQFALPRALRARRPDVLFSPGYTAPLTVPAPVVLTIHDVSFFAHPEWFDFREGLRRRQLTAWSARRARVVITDTEFSRREIHTHIGLPESRIRVIPLGITTSRGRRAATPDRREPLILFVGSIFERRRVDRLIAAFDRVADAVPGARLEIVGENRTRHPRLDLEALKRARRHGERISLRSYVDEATLGSLYERASVFAFLSEYEGFGLTPLEALAAGVPPVLLETAVARETCGAAARYVPAEAPDEAIAAALIELLTNTQRRADIAAQTEVVLSRYDWDLAAAGTLQVLEEAALGR
jgi:glycosyltransferase involved in cell wall biosynthesis